jgi:hypothetical protein
MLPAPNNLKEAARISLWLLAVLLAGAFLFYRERMIIDAAYVSFHIIHKQSLQIQANRYGSFITQAVPWLGARLHLPLRAILIAYSASFNLFYLLGAWILYRSRLYELVILMALYFTLYVSDTYFWTNNELHQGVCWMFLMFGLMLRVRLRAHSVWGQVAYYLLFTVLAFLSLYTHPLVMIPIGYLWGFYMLQKDRFRFSIKEILLHSALFMGILLFKMLSSLKLSYDGAYIRKLKHASIYDIGDTFNSDLADRFWKGCLHNYWLLPLLFIGSLYILYRKRHFLVLAWTAGFNLAFFIALCIVYDNGGNTFYIESEFMPYAILGCTAFVYFLLPELQRPRAAWLLCFIFGVRLVYIGFAAGRFTERRAVVDHMVSYMKANGIRKMIIPENPLLRQQLQEVWALPQESLYLSLLRDDTARTAVCLTEQELAGTSIDYSHNEFFDPFARIDRSKFAHHFYFHPDTNSNYQVVPYHLITGKPAGTE